MNVDMQKFVELFDPEIPEEMINKFFGRTVHHCFWPDGQLHNDGPAPLVKITFGANPEELILPNPFFIRQNNLHWLAFASLCKKHFRISGTCLHPSAMQIVPAKYNADGLGILEQGQVTLVP